MKLSMMMIVLAVLLGVLSGLVAAVSTWLDPAQVTLNHDVRAVVIVHAAWQDLRHGR